MPHSLIGADRRTHCKIIMVAVASAVSVIMLAGSAWRAEPDARTASVGTPVLKVGAPAMSAATSTPMIR
jgi:hypothetical protein